MIFSKTSCFSEASCFLWQLLLNSNINHLYLKAQNYIINLGELICYGLFI